MMPGTSISRDKKPTLPLLTLRKVVPVASMCEPYRLISRLTNEQSKAAPRAPARWDGAVRELPLGVRCFRVRRAAPQTGRDVAISSAADHLCHRYLPFSLSAEATWSSKDWPIRVKTVSSSVWRHSSSRPTDRGSQP